MNLISTLIGLIALLIVGIGMFFPLIGAILSWIGLALALVGIIFGVLSRKTGGRTLNLVVILLALFRLYLGGGII
ncbi:MAG: hypothetical protein ACEPOZ_03305 [Marinifilaceae bacterium]|jgi:uncharacterized Tic20 family protein